MTDTENAQLRWTCHTCFKQWLDRDSALACCHEVYPRCQSESRRGDACCLANGHPGLHTSDDGRHWVLDHQDGQPVQPSHQLMEYRTTTLVEAARIQDYLDDGWTVVQ